MGWMFSWDKNFNKSCLVDKFLQPGFFVEGVTLIDHRVVGNNFWAVVAQGKDRTIWLAMMQPGGEDEGWGYKSMDETAGPVRVDCPLTLLRQCTNPLNEYAAQWRSKVNDWHASKSAVKKAVVDVLPGMTLVSGEAAYIAVRPAGKRQGWVVKDTAGKLYRMPSAQVSRSVKKLLTSQSERKPEEQTCMAF